MKYFNLFKQAAPQDKIRKYKITDTYQQAFIQKYEKDVDWNKFDKIVKESGNAANALNDIIDEKIDALIDDVNEENPDNGFFYKPEEIDVEREIRENANHPAIQQAIEIYKKDPDAARKQIADIVNKTKDDVITKWLEYVMKENDVYAKNSAFQYLILNDIFKSARKPSLSAPLSLNAEVLAGVYDKIKGDANVNLEKMYDRELKGSYLRGSEQVAISKSEGWIRIPSGQNDPKNYALNENKLRDLSQGTGWCTGRGMEKEYLPEGDFWILIENGKSVVAIRFDYNYVKEIQGRHNKRPFKYFAQIEKLFDEKGFNKDNPHYRELLQISENNKGFEEGDAVIMENFLDDLHQNPQNIYKLDEKYWNDEVKKACIEAHHAKIDEAVKYLSNRDRYYVRDILEDLFSSEMPAFVRENPQVNEDYVNLAITATEADYSYQSFVPDHIKENPKFKKFLQDKFPQYISQNPMYYRIAPEYIKNDPQIKKMLVDSYKKNMIRYLGEWFYTLNRSPDLGEDHGDFDVKQAFWNHSDMPDFVVNELQKDKDFMQELITQSALMLKEAENKPFKINQIPVFVRSAPEVRKAWLNSWANLLKENPEPTFDIPEEIRDINIIRDAIIAGYAKYIARGVDGEYEKLERQDPDMASDPRIVKALLHHWFKQMQHDIFAINHAPAIVKENQEIRNNSINQFKRYLLSENTNASNFDYFLHHAPDFVKNDAQIQKIVMQQYPERIYQDPDIYIDAPANIKNDELVKENRIKGWIARLNDKAPINPPTDLANREDIKQSYIRGTIKNLHTNPFVYLDISVEYKSLPEIQKAYIEGWALYTIHSSTYQPPYNVKNHPYYREFKLDYYTKRVKQDPLHMHVPNEDSWVLEIPEIVQILRQRVLELLQEHKFFNIQYITPRLLNDPVIQQRVFEIVLERWIYNPGSMQGWLPRNFFNHHNDLHQKIMHAFFNHINQMQEPERSQKIKEMPLEGKLKFKFFLKDMAAEFPMQHQQKEASGWYNLIKYYL